MKCNDCEETELGSCEECSCEFQIGEKIICGTLGRHWHRDCIGQLARVIK